MALWTADARKQLLSDLASGSTELATLLRAHLEPLCDDGEDIPARVLDVLRVALGASPSAAGAMELDLRLPTRIQPRSVASPRDARNLADFQAGVGSWLVNLSRRFPSRVALRLEPSHVATPEFARFRVIGGGAKLSGETNVYWRDTATGEMCWNALKIESHDDELHGTWLLQDRRQPLPFDICRLEQSRVLPKMVEAWHRLEKPKHAFKLSRALTRAFRASSEHHIFPRNPVLGGLVSLLSPEQKSVVGLARYRASILYGPYGAGKTLAAASLAASIAAERTLSPVLWVGASHEESKRVSSELFSFLEVTKEQLARVHGALSFWSPTPGRPVDDPERRYELVVVADASHGGLVGALRFVHRARRVLFLAHEDRPSDGELWGQDWWRSYLAPGGEPNTMHLAHRDRHFKFDSLPDEPRVRGADDEIRYMSKLYGIEAYPDRPRR
jgi:hypothetical protein